MREKHNRARLSKDIAAIRSQGPLMPTDELRNYHNGLSMYCGSAGSGPTGEAANEEGRRHRAGYGCTRWQGCSMVRRAMFSGYDDVRVKVEVIMVVR